MGEETDAMQFKHMFAVMENINGICWDSFCPLKRYVAPLQKYRSVEECGGVLLLSNLLNLMLLLKYF